MFIVFSYCQNLLDVNLYKIWQIVHELRQILYNICQISFYKIYNVFCKI